MSFAKKFPNLNILGTFSNSTDALQAIENNKVDILFHDIDMPELSGAELRKRANQFSVCILITFYQEFAVENFGLGTCDFIETPQKKYRVLSCIGLLLKELSFQSFIRVHRSFAVQKQFNHKITTH